MGFLIRFVCPLAILTILFQLLRGWGSMPKPLPGPLYPITHCPNSQGWNHVDFSHCLIRCGIRFFQVRDKTLPDGRLYPQLLTIRLLCEKAGAGFLVNDRVDLALAVQADGVHLGQDDLPPAVARRLLGEKAVIGLSTHSWDQFRRGLEEPVDYLALGPVFPTGTKADAAPVLDPELLRTASGSTDLPLVAIGGISVEKAPRVWQSGVRSVAVISDIAGAESPECRIRAYLERSRKWVGAT